MKDWIKAFWASVLILSASASIGAALTFGSIAAAKMSGVTVVLGIQ